MNKNVWLIGPGNIGRDYLKVLQDQPVNFKVIGRSPRPDWPVEVFSEGLTKFINLNSQQIAEYAIVAVDESQLFAVTMELIESGVRNILIEKPASLHVDKIKKLVQISESKNIKLFVAYNRRFYQSVKTCKQIISNSKGPINVNFTFTEWSHAIPFDWYNKEELERFFLCNSSHVPDTVFYLVGPPKELHCYTSGGLEWHPASSVFNGSGITTKNIPISYNANWNSAGRWGIEVDLPEKKLILRPLEKLQVQTKGSFDIIDIKLQHQQIDSDYKPGLFEQVKAFLNDQKELCTIKQQLDNFLWYYKIANYS